MWAEAPSTQAAAVNRYDAFMVDFCRIHEEKSLERWLAYQMPQLPACKNLCLAANLIIWRMMGLFDGGRLPCQKEED